MNENDAYEGFLRCIRECMKASLAHVIEGGAAEIDVSRESGEGESREEIRVTVRREAFRG